MTAGSFKTIRVQKLVVGDGSSTTTKAAITAPTGGSTIDAEARTAINALITVLEQFGLVEAN